MILIPLSKLNSLNFCNENLKQAINFLKNIDFTVMQDGRFTIASDKIYMVISSYFTHPEEQSRYETHHRYLDIQYLISGEELVYHCNYENLTPDGPYNDRNDKQNYFDYKNSSCLHLNQGIVAIFFPYDAHKACCKVSKNPCHVQKLLIKVHL